MALIRGKMGLCPCPVCLVPSDKLSDASTKYPLRTGEESKATVDKANECRRKDDAEEILKEKGLQGVQVRYLSFLQILLLPTNMMDRILSGILRIQTHIVHFHLIECTTIHMDWGEGTSSKSSEKVTCNHTVH